jgi:uncharacterized protein YcgI (DUF1989 family)
MRKDPVKTLVTPNYTKKTITIRPDKDNQLFTRKQIKNYCQKQMLKLGIDDRMVVTGLNILRNSNLKEYEDDFMDDSAWDDYCKSKVKDGKKFDKFFEFTITIRQPNN